MSKIEGEFKRKFEYIKTELEEQHKKIKILETELQSIQDENQNIMYKNNDHNNRIHELENSINTENIKILHPRRCKKPYEKYKSYSNNLIKKYNNTDRKNDENNDDNNENDNNNENDDYLDDSDEGEVCNDTSESEHNTEDLVESDSSEEKILDDGKKNGIQDINNILRNLLPAIMTGSAIVNSAISGKYVDESSEDENLCISPKNREPDQIKLKINTQQKFNKYIKTLLNYFELNNMHNVSHIKYCINYYKDNKDIPITEKIHHLELCKSLLNHEYINTNTKDLKYFIGLKIEEKNNIVSNISDISKYNDYHSPIIYDILQRNISTYQKHIIIDKLKQLKKMNQDNGEYHKLKKWIDIVMSIPFNNIHKLNISLSTHTPYYINDYLHTSRKTLDNIIHGQVKTKDHIIQIIGKLISNPLKGGNVFAIYGPPGTGKTTIVKNGLSSALQMPFVFISLGGATDSSYLDGHNYTYEGSTSGRIVDVIIQSKCMNPIFYFDELDKVSNTQRGDEIINLLIHIIDSSQNNHFQDKYLSGITLDISQSIFIFSFNDISKINPILLDRMELIKVDGFNGNEKLIIARDYLLLDIMKNYNISQNNIIFSDDIINYIIDYNISCNKEEGVRNIKRRIENIISKLNVIIISGSLNINDYDNQNNICNPIHSNIPEIIKYIKKSPIIITREIVDILINDTLNYKNPPFGMYL